MQQKTREVNKTDLRWWWIYCIGWYFVPKLDHYATGGALGLALVFSAFEPVKLFKIVLESMVSIGTMYKRMILL